MESATAVLSKKGMNITGTTVEVWGPEIEISSDDSGGRSLVVGYMIPTFFCVAFLVVICSYCTFKWAIHIDESHNLSTQSSKGSHSVHEDIKQKNAEKRYHQEHIPHIRTNSNDSVKWQMRCSGSSGILYTTNLNTVSWSDCGQLTRILIMSESENCMLM